MLFKPKDIPALTTTTAIGQASEQAAANYVRRRGWKIVARNWRTRWCEVDIVAQEKRRGPIHIIEVRYRRSARSGGGLESINHDKAQRLIRAAERWQAEANSTVPIQIDVIAVTGQPDNLHIDFIENALSG